ncbi:MAG: hypothetical protein FJ246_00475 [Nitrospira sp.]|nr:hypothetical protein [Nitrospira sp.]
MDTGCRWAGWAGWQNWVGVACGWLVAVSLLAPPAGEGTARAEQNAPDLRHFWRFDTEKSGESPAGFTAGTVVAGANSEGQAGTWKIEPDPQTPSLPNRLTQEASCPSAGADAPCFQLLLANGLTYEYPDLTVRLKTAAEGSRGRAGLVFGAKDTRNFYAAIVDLAADVLEVVHVVDGQVSLIGRGAVKRKPTPWHSLRLQHNTILSKDFLEISFDGKIVFTHLDKRLGTGQIGLVTRGDAPIWFDNFDAVQLFSQRPLSPPAAY